MDLQLLKALAVDFGVAVSDAYPLNLLSLPFFVTFTQLRLGANEQQVICRCDGCTQCALVPDNQKQHNSHDDKRQ